MKKLLALVLALVAGAIPATANAAKYNYAASFEYKPSGASSGDVYSAMGTFDADLVETLDGGVFGPVRHYQITGATGKLSTDFNPDFGNVIGVDANTGDVPLFVLLSHDVLVGADFSLFADSWRDFRVSSGLGSGFGGSGEVGGTLTSLSITAAGGVPEPATWGLMILGFGLVGGAMRRRAGVRAALA